MIALTIVILLVLFAGSIESNLREAFSGDWMRFDDSQDPSVRERLEIENTEYDYGHNVRRIEDE